MFTASSRKRPPRNRYRLAPGRIATPLRARWRWRRTARPGSPPGSRNAPRLRGELLAHFSRTGARPKQAGTASRFARWASCTPREPLRTGELAARAGVALPAMSRIVDGIVQHAWAQRQAGESDHRACVISITAAGEAILQTARRSRITCLKAAWRTWTLRTGRRCWPPCRRWSRWRTRSPEHRRGKPGQHDPGAARRGHRR